METTVFYNPSDWKLFVGFRDSTPNDGERNDKYLGFIGF